MMKRFVAILLLVGGLTTLPSRPAGAARLSPVEGLELMRRGFAGMRDFTAEITQEKQIALMKRKIAASGIIRFKRPDAFYMEIYPPYASRLLLKNNILTLFLPKEGVRQKTVLPPEESLLRWFTFLDRPITALPEGVTVTADRQGETVTLRIVPGKTGSIRELQLALQEDGTLKRLVIDEKNHDRTTITFRRLRSNVGLADRDFRLE